MSGETVRKRLGAATKGPWAVSTPDYRVMGAGHIVVSALGDNAPDADADLIAHAPTDLAAALKVIEAANLGVPSTPLRDALEAFEALP